MRRVIHGNRRTLLLAHWYLKSVDLLSSAVIPSYAMNEPRDVQIQKRFGRRVRNLRKDKGFSQESLALACSLDRTYVGGVERGERNISLLNIHKIAVALGVPVKELFNV
jgi:ribosome-binding protein aMBF1 (putative translation factor)